MNVYDFIVKARDGSEVKLSEYRGKVDMNGPGAIPLFQWLTENTKFEGFDKLHPIGLVLGQMLKKQDKNYKETSSVKWNFTKFLIGKDGEIIARFEPTANLKKVKAAIEEALHA